MHNYARNICWLLVALSSSFCMAAQQKDTLLLECNISGQSNGYNYISPMYSPVSGILSVKIADGKITTRDVEGLFLYDDPVQTTVDEYMVVSNGYTSSGNYIERNLSINRNSGTLKTYKKITTTDSKIIIIQATGNCSRVANRQKF